jgi:uncharacterized protein YyaL (SSP411 family)
VVLKNEGENAFLNKEKSEKGSGNPNRLIGEKSPYLLQHAYNPVDWYPWGDEAFEKAKSEDKPIFLSIGYSTCHWCHVMAHESFEDEDVARLMNDAFISVKVDREERPDVDGAYMTAAQIMTGSGGWPLTIIMTPDKRPFFAATYIPKTSRSGRVGMLDLIPRVKLLWNNEREKAVSTATDLTKHMNKVSTSIPGAELGRTDSDKAFKQLSSLFDHLHGGFSKAPKFPTPHNLLFLMRYYKRSQDPRALMMVEKTLREMRFGGIYDHLGYGFHRYSTDETWLVPHFEKMLYDQAMLAMAYSEAYQVTKNEEYKETAKEILTYALRDLGSEEGGFYSAEDADSEGVEGKFYVWSVDEIIEELNKEDAELLVRVFKLEVEGNFTDEATRKKMGDNIFHFKDSLAEISQTLDIPLKDLKNKLDSLKKKLFNAREKRIHPGKDDKILTDWNGLMIAALSIATRALNENKYQESAKRAADFILSKMMGSNDRLLHRYKDGEAKVPGFLDDYMFLVWGLLELYETTFEPKYLIKAKALTDKTIDRFWDKEGGGFFFTANDGEKLLVRKKEIYDGAIPSGNSVGIMNLLRLSRITGNPEYEKKAEEIGKTFSKTVAQYPAAYAYLLSAIEFLEGPSQEVVIVGDLEKEDSRAMISALQSEFIPNKVVLFLSTREKTQKITDIAEFTKNYVAKDGKATAYVCSNYSCKTPTANPEKMIKILRDN